MVINGREVMLPSEELPSAIQLFDDPQAVIDRYVKQADAIMRVIGDNQKGWVVRIKGNRYLRIEAWQTIARFNRLGAVIAWTREIYDSGDQLLGYEARSEVLTSSGQIVSSGEMMCGLDEKICRGKLDPIEKRNACRSMAQTRATSKAYRLCLSFVIVLAGYDSTPAEEMDGETEDEDEDTGEVTTRRRSSMVSDDE